MEPDTLTKKLLEKASERKAGETFDQTTQRVGSVLDKRNKVMSIIEEYQKENGEPTLEEVNDNFLKNEIGIDMSMNDLKKFSVDEE